MDIDKIFGHPLADKSAVGCEGLIRAPQAPLRPLRSGRGSLSICIISPAHYLFSSTHNKTSLDQIKPIRIASATACARSVTCSLR